MTLTVRKRKTMQRWIEEALSDTDKDSPASAMSLLHMQGMQEKELHTIKFSSKVDAKNLAELFQDRANTYAQDLPGVQTFQLICFYDKSEPEAFFPFMVNQNLEAHSGLATEAPTEQGQRQQAMRWNETLLQQVYRRQQVQDEMVLRLVENLGNQNAALQRECHDAHEVLRDMMMKQALNQHEYTMKELQFQRSSAEREKWLKMAPPLVNSFMGREVFPASHADTALIETLAENLTPEAAMKIAELLPPTLLGPVMSRLSQIAEKKSKEQEEKQKLNAILAKHDDPLADARGDAQRLLKERGDG